MHDLLEALNRYFAGLPARLIARRRVVWFTSIALAAFMAAGLGRVQIDMTMGGDRTFTLPSSTTPE